MASTDVDREEVARPRPNDPAARALWDIIATVVDPEIPVLSIADLGVLRGVRLDADGSVRVAITPTYSGCPAVEAIRADIVAVLAEHGHPDTSVEVVLAPAWTSDWISEEGRARLEEYGIAPPSPTGAVMLELGIRCPHCGSVSTREVAHFGSTACKALYVCRGCGEPFDHFKQH